MKKQLICGIMSSVVLTAAATAAVAETCFEGFYTGVSLGGSFTNGTLKKDDTLGAGVFAAAMSRTTKHALRKNSGIGALYLGYGSTFDCFYLGGEVFVDWANRKTTGLDSFALSPIRISDARSIKLNSFEYGIDARPGYKLTDDSLIYARVGVAFNKLRLTETASITNGTTAISTTPFSKKKSVGALRLGAGIEQGICDNLVLRADYIYTYYGKVSTNIASNALVGTSTKRSAKLYNNAVMLGLSYYW